MMIHIVKNHAGRYILSNDKKRWIECEHDDMLAIVKYLLETEPEEEDEE